jgi:preprotein translocase subunit SecE
MSFIEKITVFLKEVNLELKKVNWSTKEQVIRYTLLVIIVSFLVAAFLGLFDFIFTELLRIFIL